MIVIDITVCDASTLNKERRPLFKPARALLEYACRWDPHGKSTKIVSLLLELCLLRHVFAGKVLDDRRNCEATLGVWCFPI